ncbi:outer membrane protein OmpK [Paraherbaspirillum soli]|uniref:Outer membrane protein OmpK n=1 Tax=Paraherbaspirillum soli TaxID=631222 RepID=A0ABW0M6G6_9BURK
MKTRNLFLALSLASCSTLALADDWSFVDANINRLEWSSPTINRTNKGPFGQKRSFTYLELEGGRGGDWGDLYGFLDLENPLKKENNTDDNRMDRRTAAKAVARFKLTDLGGLPVMLYSHVYDFRDNGFYDQNRVLGLGTNLTFGKLWIHPFLGVHQELKAGVGAQFNGGMGGYTLGYNFDAFGQSFTLSQWHETEFGRKSQYLQMAEAGNVVTAGKTAQNGAVSLWWNVNKQVTTGVSYRYAHNKLGVSGYENAMIYTLKYNF